MRSLVLTSMAILSASAVAAARDVPTGDLFAQYSAPGVVVAAVQTPQPIKVGSEVRLSVYDSEELFLEIAAIKHRGVVNEEGLALITFYGLTPGDYSFAAYLDEDGDGQLDRDPLGRPREPFTFSNGVVPKLRKPTFDETKVRVAPGSVVVMQLED